MANPILLLTDYGIGGEKRKIRPPRDRPLAIMRSSYPSLDAHLLSAPDDLAQLGVECIWGGFLATI